MKKRYSNILICFLATIIFCVGTGVTVVDLCCADCIRSFLSIEDAKDEADCHGISIMSESCCSTESSSTEIADCTDQHQDNECCTIERISADIDHAFFKPIISNPLVWSVALFNNEIFDLDSSESLTHTTEDTYRPPIPIPPREYLSLIRILII